MLEIDNTIVSLDVLSEYFACDVARCKGVCCVDGESGAPLSENEAGLLDKLYPELKPYMSQKSIELLEDNGSCWEIDGDGDQVTRLVDGKECLFVRMEAGIAKCAIEKAWEEDRASFRKPVSCHLYPVRIRKYRDFTGVSYEQWKKCKAARDKGSKEGTPVYVFLEEPLKRRFGEEWYEKLCIAARELDGQWEKLRKA
jgi:hypothetical protein